MFLESAFNRPALIPLVNSIDIEFSVASLVKFSFVLKFNIIFLHISDLKLESLDNGSVKEDDFLTTYYFFLMKKSTLAFFSFIVFLSVLCTILVVLYLQQGTELKTLKVTEQDSREELARVIEENEILEEQSQEALITYTDAGMSVHITYPISWLLSTNNQITEDIGNVGSEYGPVITTYEVTLSKNGNNATFSKILGGVGGVDFGLNPSEYDLEVISGTIVNLVRYSLAGENNWNYAAQTDCAEIPTDLVNGAEVCISPFFPGFGTATFASVVRAEGITDSGILEELDAIVLTAVN